MVKKIFITNKSKIDLAINKNELVVYIAATENINLYINWIRMRSEFDATEVIVDQDIENVINENVKRILFKKNTKKRINKEIAFFIGSDTLVNSSLPVIKKLLERHINVNIFTPLVTKEKANEELISQGFKPKKNYLKYLFKQKPDILVLANDWNGEAQAIIALCKYLKIKTICLQESVIDLKDKRKNRLRWADYIFFQGISVLNQIDRNLFFITGNPRYEPLVFIEKPTNKLALINCNFTYGVEENNRKFWLDNVTEVLENMKIDYFICKHPRDTGDLSEYKNVVTTNSSVIHSFLSKSTFVISRFSSILHEALFLGRPAIYFNPHREEIFYNYYFDNKVLFYCENRQKLGEYVAKIDSGGYSISDFENYLKINLNLSVLLPSDTISSLIENINIDINLNDSKNISLLHGFYRFIMQFLWSRVIKPLLAKLK